MMMSNGGAGRLLSTKGVFFAENAGLKVEDGAGNFTRAADNTAALQDTIDKAVSKGGGMVVLPPGRIPLDGTVNIKDTDGIYIAGYGMGVTSIARQDDSTNAILFRNASNIGISDLTNDAAGPIRIDGDTTTAQRIYARNLEHKNTTTSHLLLLRQTIEKALIENLYCVDSQTAVAVWGLHEGMFSNIVGYNMQDELLDFSVGPNGTQCENITILNCHCIKEDGSIGPEEAFDLGNVKNLYMYGCTVRGYNDGVLIKTEDQSGDVGLVSINSCQFEVGRHAVSAAFFADSDNKPAQGPVYINDCLAKLDANATNSPAAFQLKAESSSTTNTDSKGFYITNTIVEGFNHILQPNGLASNMVMDTVRGTGLKGVIDNDNNNLNGDAGFTHDWLIRNLKADAGFALSSIVENLEIDGIDLNGGPDNDENFGVSFTNAAQGLTINDVRLENFQEGGIDINYFSGAGIDPNFNQDLVIKNATMRNINLSGSGSYGIGLNMASGGSSGQNIYGFYITGIRVYRSDASDSTNRVINLQKQDYDAIDEAFITDILAAGFGQAIKNSGDLGANTVTDHLITRF